MSILIRSLIILVAGGPLVQAADPPKNEVPKPLPAAVIQAWEKAGAKVGWADASNFFKFYLADTPAQAGWLPAFQIPRWQDGMLKDLPSPETAFALDLTSTKVTDTGLKELASMLR